MKVTLIIIHWNTPEILRSQLQKLKDIDYEVVIVDNNSSQKLDWIKKEFPEIRLIKNKFNRGYAAACNQGAGISKGEWLLFLNPDVEIDKTQIGRLIEEANKKGLDACSPKTSNDYEKPLPTWLSLFIEFTPLRKIIPLSIFNQKTLFGGCLLIKNDVLKNLGGWDERFFLWFEDSDLTKRLLDANYKVARVNVPINHLGGASFKKVKEQVKTDVFFHSMYLYAKKHFSLLGKLILYLLKKRYSGRNVLPDLTNCVNITLPNLKLEILQEFFVKNANFIDEIDELIVISSSISGSDVWKWRSKYPQVRFIPIDKNKGFASTVNIGFNASSGKWLGTINDDLQLTNNWISTCLECVGDKTGSINPVIYTMTGEIESAGIDILKKGKALPKKSIARQKCFETDATNAAAILYSKEALNRVGLYDEKFGSYLEDIDLSLRLKRAGYKNIVCSTAKVYHEGHKTSQSMGARKQFLDFKNWVLVILKNWSIKELVIYFPAIVLERIRNLFGIIKALK